MAEKNYLDKNGLLYLWTKLKEIFVKKDGNKVLSDNNYTTEEKKKLAGLENYTLPKATTTTLGGIKAGAGVEVTGDGTLNITGGGSADSVAWENVQNKPSTIAGYGITDAKVDGQTVSIGSNQVVVPTNNNQLANGAGYQTASEVQNAINSSISSVYKYKGSVANQEALPESPDLGDVYNLEDTGANVAWDGTKWDNLGMTIDLTGYLKENDFVAIENSDIDEIIAN
nr:MAG TPA: Head fiber protein [Bacteriophage sp.]